MPGLWGTPVDLPADPTFSMYAATKQYVDAVNGWVPVAGRAIVPNENLGYTNAGLLWATVARYSRTVHRVLHGSSVKQVRLEYANWGNQNGDTTAAVGGTPSVGARPYEVSNTNAVSYRSSVEYPAGVWRVISGSTAYSAGTAYAIGDQVTNGGSTWVSIQAGTGNTPAGGSAFWTLSTRYLIHWENEGANRTVTCAGGATVASIPISIPNMAPGMFMAVNTIVLTGSSTNKFVASDISRSKDFTVDYATTPPVAGSGTDPVDSGVTTQTSAAAGTPMAMPLMISGITSSGSCVALIGDSIIYGFQDSDASWGYLRGWAAATMEDTQTPHFRAAVSGAEALQFLAANAPLRLAQLGRASAAICNLGVNDITLQAGSSANVEAFLIQQWQALDSLGVQVWQSTICPATTSSDSWATKVNQTVNSTFNTCRQAVNAWLRAGAAYTINGQSVTVGNPLHPLTGVIDISPYAEDPTDNTRWLTNGSANYWTLDGIHPSPAAYVFLEGQVLPYVRRLVSLGSPYPFNAVSVGAIDQLYFPYLSSYGSAQDGYIYGDVLSSCPRYLAGTAIGSSQTASTAKVYYAWLGTVGAIHTFTTAKVYVGNTNATAISLGVYVGTNTAAVQVATGTVSAPGTAGEKDVTLSNSFTVQPGQYVIVMALVTIGATTGGVLAGSAGGSLAVGGATQSGTGGTSLPTGTVNINSGFTATSSKIWAAVG
jgi:lysophospholipase L1-like esterase